MKAGKVLTALLAGVVLGVLFAPDKGSNTREKIAKKTGDLKDGIIDKFNELGDAIADKYSSIKGEAEEAMDKTKNKVQQTSNSLS